MLLQYLVFRRFLAALALYFMCGVVLFHTVCTELKGRETLLDTFYFVIVATLTIGYGDIIPVSDGAKVRASSWWDTCALK